MAHPLRHRSLDQRAGVHRIVAVVAKRIANGIRHDDRGSEMKDNVDPMFRDQRCDVQLICGIADRK